MGTILPSQCRSVVLRLLWNNSAHSIIYWFLPYLRCSDCCFLFSFNIRRLGRTCQNLGLSNYIVFCWRKLKHLPVAPFFSTSAGLCRMRIVFASRLLFFGFKRYSRKRFDRDSFCFTDSGLCFGCLFLFLTNFLLRFSC